jgi:hypothetical protein
MSALFLPGSGTRHSVFFKVIDVRQNACLPYASQYGVAQCLHTPARLMALELFVSGTICP